MVLSRFPIGKFIDGKFSYQTQPGNQRCTSTVLQTPKDVNLGQVTVKNQTTNPIQNFRGMHLEMYVPKRLFLKF